MSCAFVKLPFIPTEEPTNLWKKCVTRLDRWEKEDSFSKKSQTQMEKFKNVMLCESIWVINFLEGTLPDGLSKTEAISLLKVKEEKILPDALDDAIPTSTSQIFNHFDAFKHVVSQPSLEVDLTEESIKRAHGVMMKGLSNEQGKKIHAGEYRNISVCTGNHAYPPHTCIPRAMTTIVEDYNRKASSPDHDPYQLATWLYYNVVTLHPFEDGNGRISRLLWTYSLMKDGLPFPAVLSSGHKKSQKHLVRCIIKDRDLFYSDQPHLTTLTVYSVSQAWENWDMFCS